MNGDHGYELSPSQETLWFLAQMGKVASAAYNVVMILRFRGPLDTGALERSIAAVAQRQEILRAYFVDDHGSPRLHLAERHLGRLEYRDLPNGQDADDAAREITGELSSVAFDLAAPPLLRTVLLRGAGVDYLALIVHHTIIDGWSLGIFLEELQTFYRADRRGRPAVLEPLPSRFVELVERDRRREGSAERQRSLETWKERLAGAPPLLELPADRPRPEAKLYQGGFVQAPAGGPTVEQVRQLARSHRTTHFAPLCAAFVLLLWRLGGRRDVVIGTPVANRPTVEHETVIGPLINSLVLRNRVAPEQSFGQLMQQVQATLLEALPDAAVPFEKVVEAINPARRDDVDPIFQVMLSLEAPLAIGPLFDDGLTVDTIEPQIRTAPLDLSLIFVQNDKPHLDFGFNYDSSLFDRASIELFCSRLLTILAAAVAAPERPVGDLPWQSAAELRLLESWSSRRSPFPEAAILPDFLAGRAALTPDRIAVEAGGARLTYGELAAGARHLAERLRRRGAGPDVPVGLLLERTIDLPVAVLGVLEAGAAYLPLDPSYPPERLRYMLEDSGAPLLLTQGGLAAKLGLDGLPGCRVVDLDALGAEPFEPAGEPDGAAARAENLAYLLYTSGSTGQPKGVAISHRSLVNFLVSMAREPGLGSDDVLLAITTLSFDIAALELYLPLVCGARLVLLDRESAADVRTLQAAIVTSGASVLQATPATWQMLIAYRWPGSPGLKALCGGEGLPVSLAEALLERVGELWNVYGPTEATVWSSARRVLPGEASRFGETTVTLGKPIANTEIHILDQGGARQGIGIPGELVIGGSGLARGYWRRPGLSADRFVPDAISGRAGSRLYRTGDLARWRTGGELEFLGRLDFQVKVRGFRIELGEIENALAAHPAVEGRVVVALKGPGGEARLVAYVVPADPARPPAAEELQAFLGRGLPSHMVPAAFVFLSSLPLTPNLKVDRKALPPPGGPAAAKPARAAQSGTEKRLQPILCEVLELEAVHPDANFFALGGHSLLATRVLARIRDEFGLSLPVRAIFRYPTLGQLAAHLEQLSPELAAAAAEAEPAPPAPARPAPDPAPKLEKTPRPAPPERAVAAAALPVPAVRAETAGEQLAEELAGPLTFGQERLWLVSQLGAGANASYNITTTLRLRGVLDPERLERTFLQLIDRHPILRTAIELAGGRPVQRVLPLIDWRLQVVDLPGSEAERRAAAVAIAAGLEQQPFALDAPPLFRLILGRTATRESWLLSAFHHTIFDGYSFSILFAEMSEIYAALGEGRAPALAPPGLRMTTLARRQRERLASGALDGELDFWRRRLAGAPPLLELPADRPRPPLPSFAGGRHRWPLPEPLVDALRRLPERAGKSSFAPLMAAFAVLLSRLAGQSDLVVGTPISHRNEKQLESLIGFLVQTALLRVEVEGGTSYLELVKAVQESLFETLEHLELPFEQLVEKLAAERSASFNPLFQVMFVLERTPPAEPILGLRYEELAPPRLASHFDLTLLAIEEADGINLVFDYATDLFDARTIAGWAGLYTRLLAAAVADPDAPIASLDPLGPAERKSLLALSSGGRRRFELGGEEPTLFDLFARQAARTPAAPAVAAADAAGRVTEWSYAELAERAAAVAAELALSRLPAGAPVALALSGGGWAIAALLGVLQAGGCYVPLDPGAPPARLADLLAASGATLLLFESRRPPEPALFGGRQVAVDQLPLRPAPARRVGAGLPAYLIFTSGSTGTPKGVLVAHRSAVNLTHAFAAAHGFRAGQRWLVVPPLYFDASVGDIFPALATGGTLVFHGAPERLDAEALLVFCDEQRITVIDTAAALFKQWVDSWRTLGRRRVLPELEILMVGGEAVGLDQVAAWHAMQGGRATFYNHYGPTETTVCATLCGTRNGAGFSGSTLPIGRPLANVATYVASPALELQPAGVPGELLIGGAGVALGYSNAPAKTAEAFVPDPFSREPGARLYRTGDLVRLRPDGELEFLGRADRQVKLRGYRIELGEIEAQLRRHPAIAEALVMVREDQPGARRLVAYLRAVGPAAAAELQQLAQERLPAYMAPSAFVFLESFPLTPNGKIDQRALPAPAAAEKEKRPLAGEAQRRLAAIWRELLGGDPAAGDDFFESGGSSLLLMQLAARLRQETGREVPLPLLFETSRLEDMARLLESGAPQAAAAGPALDLEVVLDEEIRPSRRPLRAVGARWSLVTGGTGFLGAYLIDELLRRERGSIYVLVRAENEDDARRRLRQNLRQYGLWRDDAAFRLLPVLGQLDLPRFGLAPEAFAELAQSIDVIFHNAATVNFLAPYSKLEAVNVAGTEETIRLAAAGGAVPLHFVSTLGVFLQQRYELQQVREEDDPAWEGLHKGYEQTKWVAEKLVEVARKRGLPASIHRPARVSGAAGTGSANTADLFYSLLRGCSQLGAAPDLADPIDLYPVDVLARAMVAISQRFDGDPEWLGRSFHYYNEATVPFAEMIRSLVSRGAEIELIPYADWRRRLLEAVESGQENALSSFLGLYPPEAEEDRQPFFDQLFSRRVLSDAGIEIPPADEKLLSAYWTFLFRSGFLATRR